MDPVYVIRWNGEGYDLKFDGDSNDNMLAESISLIELMELDLVNYKSKQYWESLQYKKGEWIILL